MTIGVAASGRWAGAGILAGLRAVEAVGHGAIGGFVSLAVLTEDQKLLRAETQSGGSDALFEGDIPAPFLSAPRAALISSGPDRPPPLSQFVAASPGVGLVTGHRFPQARPAGAQPLNSLILDAMRSGAGVQTAIDGVIAEHSAYDAGFIALSAHGEVAYGNMPSVLRRSDQGALVGSCKQTGAMVATVHNAIQPHRAIALLANEVALRDMRLRDTRIETITVAAGVALRPGDAPEIIVDASQRAHSIFHPDIVASEEEVSFGMGDRVKVTHSDQALGWLLHEPFMVVKDGIVLTLDGKAKVELSVGQLVGNTALS